MRCVNCGSENDESDRFCRFCGAAMLYETNLLRDRMFRLLQDDLFLAICLLYSIGTGLSFLSLSLPVVQILISIFLWMVYAKGKKGVIAANHMRCISGTIFAQYVINWVLYSLFAVLALCFMALIPVLDFSWLENFFYSEMEPYLVGALEGTGFFMTFYVVVIAVTLIVSAIIGILMNIFGIRSIHKFAQSVYKSLECGQMYLVKRRAAQTWLMVLGIMVGVSSLALLISMSLFSFLSQGCIAAALIISSILIGKYFSDVK